MKKYKYSCGGGSIVIGNDGMKIHIPNGYGDGTHSVTIAKRRDAQKIFTKDGWWDFKGMIAGNDITVYDYDCLKDDEWDKHRIIELSGVYNVYANMGNVLIVEV